ncbi:hypothetical protein [Brachybacterium sp. AOP3-A1-3]|uniref:hypothetical protein n=1 Tax=Brachybacterium sp. AOP3-A1-3 TaxID=3457699 RepID=UPI0040337164
MTAPERAPLGAALAMLLTLVSLTGPASPVLMAVIIGALALLAGIGWPNLLELPSALGTRIVIATVGIVGAAVAVSASERFAPVSGIVMICAAGVFAAFVQQMLRTDRRELTSSLTGTVAGVFLSGTAACWVIAQVEAVQLGREGLVASITAGLAATLLLNLAPLPPTLRFVISLVAGTGITALLATSLAGTALPFAIGAGLLTAIGAGCTQLLVGSSLVSKEPLPSLAVGAVPVATIGVVAQLAVTLIP